MLLFVCGDETVEPGADVKDDGPVDDGPVDVLLTSGGLPGARLAPANDGEPGAKVTVAVAGKVCINISVKDSVTVSVLKIVV